MNKSVLVITTRGIVGGVSSILAVLLPGLSKTATVTLGYGQGNYLADSLSGSSISIKKFRHLRRSHNPFYNFAFAFEVFSFVRRKKFSTVSLHSSNTLFAAPLLRLLPVRIVFTVHGLSFLDAGHGNTLVRGMYWIVYKVLWLFVHEIVFVSKKNMDRAIALSLLSKRKAHFIPNAIARPDFLPRSEARKKLSERIGAVIDENAFVLGSVGRLAYPKNYEFLISSMPRVLKKKPGALCIIVGEGSERARYEKLISKLSLQNNVFLVGEIRDARAYLRAFDVFVLCSLYEGMSIVLLEALHAKIPILASNVGGNSEILDRNCLFSFSEDNFVEKALDLDTNRCGKNPDESTMVSSYAKLLS